MQKISAALDGFFESFGIKDEKNYLGFIGAWPKIAGEELACHSRPSDIRGSALIICVDHPGWMTRMQFSEKDILRKITKQFPQLGIHTLGFKLVEKLPKPKALEPIVDNSPQLADTLVTSSEQVVDNKDAPENSGNQDPTDLSTSPQEFLTALRKLGQAINKKSRNDS